MTWMLLFKRSQVSILIMNKFNLHRFDNLSIVFAQAMSINIPLLITEIGCLQGTGQFFFLQVRNSFPTCHQIVFC